MNKVLLRRALLTAAFGFLFAWQAFAQSPSQEFPTPVLSNDVSGSIKPRDVGDARLTTYYYAFNGEQGDLFINLVTRNFAGDIDIFTASGLRPLTKIVVYADYGESETGRAIYLRKPEKLLLRVQGRTPNDDEATFRLKFAGSFLAARPEDVPAAPELPKVNAESRAGIRVNSVGTILPAPPKSVSAAADREPIEVEPADKQERSDVLPVAKEEKSGTRPEVIVSDTVRPAEKSEPVRGEADRTARRRTTRRNSEDPSVRRKPANPATDEARTDTAPAESRSGADAPSFRTLTDSRRRRQPETPELPMADPLASINLVVQFKNGESLEKKMSEVLRFTVDKGVLTVILKNGSVTRYPIVDVAKVTIE